MSEPPAATAWVQAGRWTLLVVAAGVGFSSSLRQLVGQVGAGDPVGYVIGVPFYAVVAAVGITVRHRGELPIHDRQADGIVGAVVLGLALAVQRLLVPRFTSQAYLWGLDLLALVLFLLGGAVLLFGLRPVARYRWAWLALAAAWPLPYRVLVAELGGSAFVCCVLAVATAAAAVGIAVGGTRLLVSAAVAATAVVGVLATDVVLLTDLPLWTQQLAAGALASTLVGAAFLVLGRPARQPRRAPVTKPSLTPVVWLAAAAAVAALVGTPDPVLYPVAAGPPTGRNDPVGAAGWLHLDDQRFPAPAEYYGAGTVWRRDRLQQEQGSTRWDVAGLPRTVVVDTITTPSRSLVQVVPLSANYALPNTRTQRAADVDLGDGVIGRVYALVDDDLLLTYTVLSFVWTRGSPSGPTQRVTAISVDDHRESAAFPLPAAGLLRTVSSGVARIIRGDAVFADLAGRPKDADLVTELGRGLIAHQTQAAPT